MERDSREITPQDRRPLHGSATGRVQSPRRLSGGRVQAVRVTRWSMMVRKASPHRPARVSRRCAATPSGRTPGCRRWRSPAPSRRTPRSRWIHRIQEQGVGQLAHHAAHCSAAACSRMYLEAQDLRLRLFGVRSSARRLQNSPTQLIALHAHEQRAEITLTESVIAAALDDLEENRADQGLGEYLQQETALAHRPARCRACESARPRPHVPGTRSSSIS